MTHQALDGLNLTPAQRRRILEMAQQGMFSGAFSTPGSTPFASPEEIPQRPESKPSAHYEQGPRPDARRSPASEPPQAPDLKRDRRTGQHSRGMVRLPGRMIEFVKFTWLHTSPYMREVMTFDYCQALREVDNTVFQPPRSGTWLGGPCDLDIWKTLLTPSPTPAQTIPLSLLGCHPPARPRPL